MVDASTVRMQIAWAVYGEKNGGHALLSTSDKTGFAAKLTQYTDRPGDPPHGVGWGPVESGFPYGDYYILLRTLPDAGAGRAGMVRSYAAFLPLGDLGLFSNLTNVFEKLPCDLGAISPTLPEIQIQNDILQVRNTSGVTPGLAFIAHQLGAPEPKLPLVWNSKSPYLPTIDAIWARLPLSLKSVFAFTFQFAPEHKFPISPTILATEPAFATRWPSSQIIPLEGSTAIESNSAQKWFAAGADTGFAQILDEYGITLKEFREINVISSFADAIPRLAELTFGETRKAIRILEKYSRPAKSLAKKRASLFERLCTLVREATPQDIETLRNFDDNALSDLIPALQNSIHKWVETSIRDARPVDDYVKTLELAVRDTSSWWSTPFVKWLRNLSKSLNDGNVKLYYEVVIGSQLLTDFLSPELLKVDDNQERMVAGLPKELNKNEEENLLKLAEAGDWMRLHALCLMRRLPGFEAARVHAKSIVKSTAGLDLIREKHGLAAILHAACTVQNTVVDQYTGRQVKETPQQVPTDFGAECMRWPTLLSYAVRTAEPLPDQLRDQIGSCLSAEIRDPVGIRLLCESCFLHEIGLLLRATNPSELLNVLAPDEREKIIQKLNDFVVAETTASRRLKVAAVYGGVLDGSRILEALRNLPLGQAAMAGAVAFGSLQFLTDLDCRDWLIDLFTRTQYQTLDAQGGQAISQMLHERDFPESAKIVADTAEKYDRRDVAPIWSDVRYKYEMGGNYGFAIKRKGIRVPKVLIATALPLERTEVIRHLPKHEYRPELFADMAYWPPDNPEFEVYVIATGAGNLAAQSATFRFVNAVKPTLAFFVGVGGGVKDSEIGDVIYGTKVYYTEGGKEEADGIKSRPSNEYTSEPLVQLAHRVAESQWQPPSEGTGDYRIPKATPAVIASGEKVLASTESTAGNYQKLKNDYNDTQVVDMEAYGFLAALRTSEIRLCMVLRGVSDKINKKGESDALGNQPLAARNATAFLFALLGACPSLLPEKKRGFFNSLFPNLFADPNTLP